MMKRVSKLPQWPPRAIGALKTFPRPAIMKLLLLLFTTTALTAIVYTQLGYYKVGASLEQMRAGQPAPSDIHSPGIIHWEDAEATMRRQDDAVDNASIVYAHDPGAIDGAQKKLEAIFDVIQSGNGAGAPVQVPISPADLSYARNLDSTTRTALKSGTMLLVKDIMLQGVKDDAQEVERAQGKIAALVHQRISDSEQARLVESLAHAILQPTDTRDEQKTAENRRRARSAVETVMRTYQLGEIIFRRGDLISADDLRQLTRLQVLIPAPWQRLAPVAILIFFALGIIGAYFRSYQPALYANDWRMLLLALLIMTALWITLQFGKDQPELVYLLAIPGAGMAIAGLLGAQTALISTVLVTVIAGLTADQQYAMLLLTLSSSLVGIIGIAAIWPASRGIQAILCLIGINFLFMVVLEWMHPGASLPFSVLEIGKLALWAVVGGFGSTLIAVGTIYLFARLFGILTPYRLMELTNAREPLLRRLMLEAPGSYHSSVMVANMAEAAADAIGANALLTRVAALYHDIGKLKRPAFFAENQAPLGLENAHERLSPRLSYLILASHPRDGAEMAKQYKLPAEVVDIIREHHGTTLTAYFYHRALNEAGEKSIAEHDFRYPGPRPSTREAAVVMLADQVQASVKSLREPTPGRIEGMVRDIVQSRLADGQLEECAITLRDLHRVSEVFIRILTGLYTYTRLEYPDIKSEGARVRGHLNQSTTSTTAGAASTAASSSS